MILLSGVSDTVLPVAIVLVSLLIAALVFGRVLIRMRNQKRLMKEGDLGVGVVVALSQTGVVINQINQMKITLDLENAGGTPRRIEIRQLLDLGSIPRQGDRVYVFTDPKDPDNVMISPAQTVNVKPANSLKPQKYNADQTKDLVALSPEIRKRGVPGVAKVLAIRPTLTSASEITLLIDSIGQKATQVTITQVIDGATPGVGNRIYILTDPENPTHVALLPASFSSGQSLGSGSNRLDPLVLGPQLLTLGAKAMGSVESVKQISLANELLASKGFSKWELVLMVKPESALVPPYKANLTIALTSKEKADKIAREGAEVPLRYDPNDLQTISIDSPAMGYPDPYAEVIKTFQEALAGSGG